MATPVRIVGLKLIPPARLDVAHRVLPESLTNVLRHVCGAAADVTITVEDDLRIVVLDGGAADGAGDAPARRGYGLIGLAERVGFACGALHAVPGPGGGYRVEVFLPAVADRVVT